MSDMELRQLELFVAVAEERQFTRAAQRCHIGQSALSTSIRTLERDLGVMLFARTTRRVDLTTAGLILLDEGRRTLAAAEVARQAVRTPAPGPTDRLSVGGIGASGGIDQLAILADFRRDHPDIEVRYVRASTGPLMDDVRVGRLDAAFVTLGRTMPTDVHVMKLATQPLCVLCRFDTALAQRASVELADLSHEEFVTPPAESFGGDWFRAQFGVSVPMPRASFIVDDVTAMLEFVSCGLGVTLLPASAAVDFPLIRAIPITGSQRWRTIGLMTRPLDRVSPEARSFLDSVAAYSA